MPPQGGDSLQQNPAAGLWRFGTEQIGCRFPGGLVVRMEADDHAQADAECHHAPGKPGDRGTKLIGVAGVVAHNAPNNIRQGVLPDEDTGQGAYQRRIQGIAQVVGTDLMISVAQRLQGAHLNALILDHSRQGADNNHGRYGEGQHREDVA